MALPWCWPPTEIRFFIGGEGQRWATALLWREEAERITTSFLILIRTWAAAWERNSGPELYELDLLRQTTMCQRIRQKVNLHKHNFSHMLQTNHIVSRIITYRNWAPWEKPIALYPPFNCGSLASWVQTMDTCSFTSLKNPFSVSCRRRDMKSWKHDWQIKRRKRVMVSRRIKAKSNRVMLVCYEY